MQSPICEVVCGIVYFSAGFKAARGLQLQVKDLGHLLRVKGEGYRIQSSDSS